MAKTKKLTIGTKTNVGYRKIYYNKKTYEIHRLIFETFSGKLLQENEIIDHINTVKDDNRFSNLRKDTPKDNMNNPLTKNKISKSIKQFTYSGNLIREYNSIEEAAKLIGFKPSALRCSIYRKKYWFHNYLWCFSKDEEKLKIMFNNIIFKYDSSGKLIKGYKSIREAKIDSTSDRKTISNCIKSGKLCTDNCYYSKGPKH